MKRTCIKCGAPAKPSLAGYTTIITGKVTVKFNVKRY